MRLSRKQYLFAYLIIALTGTLLHFTYGWSKCLFVATFSATNESTWEHMKLLFFPSTILGAIYLWMTKQSTTQNRALMARYILYGTWMIPVLFYTYRGIWGHECMVIDVGIFFVAELLMLWKYSQALKSKREVRVIYIVMLYAQLVLFVISTFFPCPYLGIMIPL